MLDMWMGWMGQDGWMVIIGHTSSKSTFGATLVDCRTQLILMTWICQLCSMTNTSEKYERTEQGNLLVPISAGNLFKFANERVPSTKWLYTINL